MGALTSNENQLLVKFAALLLEPPHFELVVFRSAWLDSDAHISCFVLSALLGYLRNTAGIRSKQSQRRGVRNIAFVKYLEKLL